MIGNEEVDGVRALVGVVVVEAVLLGFVGVEVGVVVLVLVVVVAVAVGAFNVRRGILVVRAAVTFVATSVIFVY